MYKTLKKKLKMFRENNMTNPKSSVENKVMTHKSSRKNNVKASESFKQALESFRNQKVSVYIRYAGQIIYKVKKYYHGTNTYFLQGVGCR